MPVTKVDTIFKTVTIYGYKAYNYIQQLDKRMINYLLTISLRRH